MVQQQQPPPPPDPQPPFNDLSSTLPDVSFFSFIYPIRRETIPLTCIYQTSAFNLDFSALENPDILDNFDFDTFLNTDADTAGFGFDPNISYATDGVETGAGDSL